MRTRQGDRTMSRSRMIRSQAGVRADAAHDAPHFREPERPQRRALFDRSPARDLVAAGTPTKHEEGGCVWPAEGLWQSSGRPLDRVTREYFEARLGTDLSS